METWLDRQDAAKVETAMSAARERGFVFMGRDMLDMAGGDERFALWLAYCDVVCSRKIGLGIFDISDWTWADAYESGMSPRDAVMEALADDDLYGSMFSE